MDKIEDPAERTFERLFGPEFGHGKPLDLAPMRAAVRALGDPQDRLPPVIHVAGTNGKGSTIAFMRAIAEADGMRVHAFTKPHLFQLNERFIVSGKPADDATLIETATRIAEAGRSLTQFDAQVAAAFLLFAERRADMVFLETGMGGRDDSTNVIARPALSVLTPIALDHQDALGSTLTEIAAHKAGILKSGVPAIVARQAAEVMDVIEAHAAAIGAPLFRQGVEWDAYLAHGNLVVQTDSRALDLPAPTLAGAHQADNAGLAVAAMLRWREFHDDAVAQGVLDAWQAARLQPLTNGPFSAPLRARGGDVWIDSGHNAHAGEAVARWLAQMQKRRAAPVIAVIGMRARKDAEAFIGALAGAVDRIIAVPLVESHIAPAEIAALASARGMASTTAHSLAAAMQNAAQFPAPRVLISGSFLLAAEALAVESGA